MDIHGTVSMKNENRYKSLKYVSDYLELLAFSYNYIIRETISSIHIHPTLTSIGFKTRKK